MAKDGSQARIVVSYRRDDAAALVYRVAERLGDRFGPSSVFVDVHAIRAGDDWAEALERSISGADVLLVMIGPNWRIDADDGEAAEHDVVRWEIQTALEQKLAILPVLLDGAAFPEPEALPQPIRRLARFHAYSLHSGRFEAEVGGLVQSVEAQIELTAPWARRVLAFGLDALVPVGVFVGVEVPGVPPLAMAAGVYILYHWLLVGATGTTLGKLLAGTTVVFLDGGTKRWANALLRPTVGYVASLNPLGFAQAMLHPHAFTFHDRLFRTRVLRARAKVGGPLKRRLDALSQAVDELEAKALGRLGRLGRWISVAVFHHFGVGPLLDRWRGGDDGAGGEEPAGLDAGPEPATAIQGGDPVGPSPAEAGGSADATGGAGGGSPVGEAAGGDAAAAAVAATTAGLVAASAAPLSLVAATLPGLSLGAALAVASVATYEVVAPPAVRILDRSREVVVAPDQPPVVGTRALVLFDVSGSMSDDETVRDGMIEALREGGLRVKEVPVNTGGVDGTLMRALTANHEPGMDALFFFSDFADGDPSVADLRRFVAEQGMRLYVGTVEQDPGAEIRAIVTESGGAVIDQAP